MRAARRISPEKRSARISPSSGGRSFERKAVCDCEIEAIAEVQIAPPPAVGEEVGAARLDLDQRDQAGPVERHRDRRGDRWRAALRPARPDRRRRARAPRRAGCRRLRWRWSSRAGSAGIQGNLNLVPATKTLAPGVRRWSAARCPSESPSASERNEMTPPTAQPASNARTPGELAGRRRAQLLQGDPRAIAGAAPSAGAGHRCRSPTSTSSAATLPGRRARRARRQVRPTIRQPGRG